MLNSWSFIITPTMGEDEVEHEVIVDQSDDDDLRRVILDEQMKCGSGIHFTRKPKTKRALTKTVVSALMQQTRMGKRTHTMVT